MDIISNICATCLNSNTNSLKTTLTTSFDVSYDKKLKICLPQYVSEYLDMGQCYLCEDCAVQLDGYYKFLMMSLESKKRLEEMVARKKESDTFKQNRPDMEKKFSCRVCRKRFRFFFMLKQHLVKHVTRSFVCRCGRTFPTLLSVLSHQRTSGHSTQKVHNKTTNFPVSRKKSHPCHICTENFLSQHQLIRHSTTHINFRPFICECGRMFSRRCGLNIHQRSTKHATHTVDKTFNGAFICCVCGRKFGSSSELVHHDKTHPKRESQVSECGKRFSKKMNLRINRKFCGKSGRKIVSKIRYVRFHVKSETVAKKFTKTVDESKTLSCEECGKVFTTLQILRRHMMTHSGEKPFPCSLCPKKFARPDLMNSHVRSFHEKIQNYTCNVCGKGFYLKSKLKLHIESHSRKKYFKCNICNEGFDDAANCERHVQQHSDSSLNNLRCSPCQVYFASETSLNNHTLITHNEEKTFICNLCQKPFQSKKRCNEHIKISHDRVRNHVCAICGKAFYSKHLLKLHVNSHTGVKNYKCPICSKTFAYSYSLKLHVDRHADQRNFLCSQCGACFHTGRTLKCHLVTHALDKPNPCPHCDKKFIAKYQLRNHVNLHHLNFKPFVCDVCKKGFVRAMDLKSHKASHSDDRPFSCPTCSATFKNRHHVTRHLRNNVCSELGKDTKVRKRKTTKYVICSNGNSKTN